MSRGRSGIVLGTLAVALATASPAGAATPVGTTFIPDSSCSANATIVISGPARVRGPERRRDHVLELPGGCHVRAGDAQAEDGTARGRQRLHHRRRERAGVARCLRSSTRSPRASRSPPATSWASTRRSVGGHCFKTTAGFDFHRAAERRPSSGIHRHLRDGHRLRSSTSRPPSSPTPTATATATRRRTARRRTRRKNTDCAPPDTTITTGRRRRPRRRRRPSSSRAPTPRAVAGFECSLDGGAFAACSSPHTVKVKKGKHTFSVRATDQAGNVDASPATYSWKVKKKEKAKVRRALLIIATSSAMARRPGGERRRAGRADLRRRPITCAPGLTFIQSGSPNGSYSSFSRGVITSWQVEADAGGGQLKLKIVRPPGAWE